jgi:hypothetical protein
MQSSRMCVGTCTSEKTNGKQHNSHTLDHMPSCCYCCCCCCRLLSARVKLVGPTISCAGAPAEPGAVNSSWRLNPHIPFSAVATDR